MNKTNAGPAFWHTAVSEIKPDEVLIRGYPMSGLVGRLPFSGIAYLLIRGEVPTPGAARMMDVLFSSILDYGLQKSGTLAARAVVSVNPQMTAGLGAAMLAAGPFAVSPEEAGRFIADGLVSWRASGLSMQAHAEAIVAELRAARKRVPGFGHQVFKGTDPRALRLKEIAQREAVWGEANDWYEAVHVAFCRASGKPDLVMNDVGMLAAIMVQMGFTPEEMCGIALVSTMPGLIAHISEELQSGIRNRLVPDSHVTSTHPLRDFDKDFVAAGWKA
jgi:citryl-CoA lyase